ncbi:HAD family hydrolase [Microbacterium sp. MPKO10]|uniref:HAD family hydrolase n=1 Tax=Microbacterium sp. MPKO10 TaxID=2989818 RepID=UPI00223644C2|nr:HAD family phosphatase [Microbacterium sp. MPKO10]MCW4458949.1 HAD family phosphatase [Microbacterium sp. MPKO10]
MTIDGGTLTVEPARQSDDDVEFYDVPVELIVLDVTGMTDDAGASEAAFLTASVEVGLVQSDDDRDRMLQHVRGAMGQPTIDVFRAVVEDESTAQAAQRAFDVAYRAQVSSITPAVGAERTLRLLRESGTAIVLTSPYSRDTTIEVVDQLGWRDLVDAVLSSDDVGRGLPFPDLPLTAVMRTGARSVDGMIVVGAGVAHVRGGLSAGAGLVVGVLAGGHTAEQLHQAGADEVLTSLEMLPALLGISAES